MVLKGFPDFIHYNNTQAAKGYPRVSWPEFLRIRKHALIRQEAARSLLEPSDGPVIRLLPLYPDPKEQPVRAPETSSEDILELTEDMEVSSLPECVQVHALCDGSGPIGSI